jgi:glucose/arabinose dehydrogenase
MTKIKTVWLWIIVGIELAAIGGLLIWSLVFRHTSAPKVTVQPQTTQKNPTSYKTPAIQLSKVVAGLSAPTAIIAMPTTGDARLFVVEQAGTIRVVTAQKNLDATPFLDIKSKVLSGGEMGLLGLAFHPQVADNNYFYINYIDKSRNTIIARYSITRSTGRADPNSEHILLKLHQPYENHNGGDLAFGPDGYLYIGLGDGGSGSDPQNHAQNRDDLLGKMLRINVDSGDTYVIPDDNPFVKEGGKPEIWALGLRNPWRFSFDRKTGDLYVADVGQGTYEEIDFQPANSKGGQNYGWACREAGHILITAVCKDTESYQAPIIEYDHSQDRCSVTGGYVYRGNKYPAIAGKYFYSDFCGGQIYYTERSNGAWATTLAASTDLSISTFGQDTAGELYLADYNTGTIYQLIDTAN